MNHRQATWRSNTFRRKRKKSGEMVRITAQLIKVDDGYHFWSQTWDRKLDDIFAVQDEIALEIAGKLRGNLGHFFIEEQLVKQPTDNIEAYNLFLEGRHYVNQWNEKSGALAVECFEKAIE